MIPIGQRALLGSLALDLPITILQIHESAAATSLQNDALHFLFAEGWVCAHCYSNINIHEGFIPKPSKYQNDLFLMQHLAQNQPEM